MRRLVLGLVPAVLASLLSAPVLADSRPRLDLYFVVDTSASTIGFDYTALYDVAKAIDTRRVALRVGVAEYTDVDPLGTATSHPLPGGLPTYVTWRRLALTSDMKALRDVLDNLHPSGGGDTREDAGRALQAAAGVDVWPFADHDSAAGFGDGYRLVLLVTDAGSQQGGLLYPSATDTEAAMRDRHVHVASLLYSPLDATGPAEDADSDASRMAVATGTTARRGTDCDGDRRTDLAVGDPFVCAWPTKPFGAKQSRRGVPSLAAGIRALVGR